VCTHRALRKLVVTRLNGFAARNNAFASIYTCFDSTLMMAAIASLSHGGTIVKKKKLPKNSAHCQFSENQLLTGWENAVDCHKSKVKETRSTQCGRRLFRLTVETLFAAIIQFYSRVIIVIWYRFVSLPITDNLCK